MLKKKTPFSRVVLAIKDVSVEGERGGLIIEIVEWW